MDLRKPAPDRPAGLNPQGWPRPRGYANGMMGRGTVVVTGGLVGWDAEQRFADGFATQARPVFLNIVAVLAAGGAGPEHLIRLTWYVVRSEEHTSELQSLIRILYSVLYFKTKKILTL